jgi:predicted GNAT family acetyltransferase
MPPSITDNPEAFFEELNKPQKEETAVPLSPVATPVADTADSQVENPLTGSVEQIKEKPSVADDPEAFFAGLTRPLEQKEETPQSVVLNQLAGKTGAEMDDFDMKSLDLLSPKELEEVTNQRRDIPLSENLLRTKFDYEMSLPWNEGINKLEDWKKIGQEVFGGGVSFLKGAQKFAEQSLFSEAEQDPSGWGHPSFKPVKDYVSGIASLPESAAYLFTKLKEGGMGVADRLSESIGVQDREKSYENYKARNLVDRIQAQETQENPSIYSRILKGDMANDALSYVVLNTLPDRETLMAQEGLTAEQADNKRKEIANAIARQTTSDIASREKPADEDIATFATFTAPAGLGLGEMGLVSLGLEAGMGLTPKIAQGIKYLGKTDQEIKAMNDAAQALQKEQALQGLEKAQRPSMLGRAAGALATGIENTGAAFAKIGEATPNILKELAPPAIGAVVAGDERRGEGAIVGALFGKAGRPALAALKYAAKTPALIRDIEEARVLAAGGSKGTFETLASFPEVSENAAKILRFGGRRLDNTLNNVVEYAKAGVNPTLIALGTGALDSASPEELNKLTSTGLLYGLGGRVVHQAWGKITGVDPVIDARNRRQQDIDDLKTYRDLDPETRKTLDSVTSWDNIIERHTQRAANAEQAYNDAVALGKKDAEQLGKVAQAEKNVLSAVTRANVQTRDELSRQFVSQLTNLNQLVNGTLRAGQNNVGINILTPDQIIAKFRSDPANATATDQEILDVASQRGFYSTPEGSVEYQAGMSMDAPKKKIVFDRTKPSVVINADALKARMMIEGSTPIDALNHEVGHHVRNIPEFREANKDAEDLLFSQEVKDPAGNVVAVTAGQYSGKDLVDMYLKSYLKGKTPDQITQLSQLAGLWDYSRGALNESAVADYMKDEIIAELNSETFSTHLGKGLDNSVLHMVDVARLKTKKNLLDRAVQKFFGLGGKGEATSDLTGARFSPDVLAANRQAMRALQSLQGEVSQAVTSVDSPKISRSEMLKNKAIRERYGKYAGLFKTKMQGQVFDGNGNPIGSPIDITNPSASEGSWESRNGEIKQLNGYGARPDEVAEAAGVVIPDGGRLVVQKQIVTQPDGVTPVMMTPKEAKDLQKNRAEVIRQSLNTPDEGAPNRFEAVNDDSETWRGTFTPLQIQAIKDMPEGIIPKSIKEHMLKINDMIVKGDGGRMLVDYAAVMNDAGKYTAYSPKIYDVVPIGMHLSKGGNFLVTTISVGRMFDKLNAWSERMPARLAPWGGSKDAFFKEFTEKYLQNWQNGLAGETGLSGNNAEALAKKDIFNDFLNLTTNDFRGANMDRTTTPRRRGDARGKNIDRTIMSMRLDHMAELMDNENAPKVPIDYGKAIKNFMPAESAEPSPAQEERRPTPFDGITADYDSQGRSFRARYVPAQMEGETKDDYVNRVMSARENPDTLDTSYTPLAGSQYDYMEGSSRSGANDIAFMPKSEAREEERTERIPASGAELTASLVASGTSLESFGKGTLIQLAESYGIELPKDAKRGEIIDAINERPIQAPVAGQPQGDISFMPAAGESKPVPTQEELDVMKARLPEYSAKTEKYSGKYGDVIKIYSPDRSREVGFAIIGESTDRDNTIDVYETNVDLRYRGKGYGEALYREIAKYAQGKDADTLFGGSVTPEAQKVRSKLFETQPSTTSGFGVESKVPSDISFMPSSKLDEAHADLEKRYKAGDEAAIEEAQRLVDERAVEAGFDLSHHEPYGEDWRKKKDVVLFAKWNPNEISPNYQYGPAKYIIKSSDLKPVPEWAIKWHSKQQEIIEAAENDKKTALELARDSMNPNDIVDGAGMWDSRISVADFYNDNESRLYKEGTIGYLTPDGAVIFDPYTAAEKGIAKLADPFTYDDEGKLIPLSQRFDTSKPDIRFMPKSEEPEITEEGHVMPKTMDKPFAFTPQVAINFMPATEQVNLEDYLDRPIIALAADRMGIGQAYVGPTGAKQPLSMESQGGAGFSTLYRDEEHNPIWAFSKEQPALNFLKRINDVAEEYGVDSVLVAPTLLASDNHLKNQTGQLGYVEAMEAAVKAKMIKPSALNAQINEIIKRIAESDSSKAKQTTKRLEGISTFAEFADAVRKQSFNFADAEWLMNKAAQKKLPITAKELDQMGLLPSQIAKDLAHEGFYELPNFSVVSLFEVPKKQKPEKGMYHNAYPYIVRGKSIGYLKNIINLSQATKDPKVFNKGQIQSQPLMTVMPIIDKVLVKKALETLKAYTTPSK